MGIVRLALALAVLSAHTGGLFGRSVSDPALDVETFYLISGFLMQLVLERRYDPRSQLGLFYSNRMLRIFPSYYVVLAASIVVGLVSLLAGHSGFYGDAFARLSALRPSEIVYWATTQAVILGQDVFLFLGGSEHGWVWSASAPDPRVWTYALVPPAWSVSLELLFYLLVPFLARLRSRWLVALVALSFLARWIGFAAGLAHDPWTYRFFPFELGVFAAGMLAYRVRHALRWPARTRYAAVPLLLLLLGSMPELEQMGAGAGLQWAEWQVLVLSLAFLTLPTVFRSTAENRIDARIGELSYPLYLCHWLVLSIYNQFIATAPGSWPSTQRTLVCAGVALVLSFLLAKYVDRKMDRLRARRRATSPALEEALAPSP